MKVLNILVIMIITISFTFCDSKGKGKVKKQEKQENLVFEPTKKPADSIGEVSYGKRLYYIQEAVTVYDPKKKYLVINFFPFKLTPKDIENVLKGRSYSVKKGKPSPNKTMFSDWTPYGKATVGFTKESDKIDPANIKSGYFYLNGMKKKNSSDNKNILGKSMAKVLKTFKGELKEGGKLELDLDLDTTYFKKKLIIKLKLNSTIHLLNK